MIPSHLRVAIAGSIVAVAAMTMLGIPAAVADIGGLPSADPSSPSAVPTPSPTDPAPVPAPAPVPLPTDPVPVPTEQAPVPAPTPGPGPGDPAPVLTDPVPEPTPSTSAPGSVPPGSVAPGSPVASPQAPPFVLPAPAPIPLPNTDGILPAPGVSDSYWDVYSRLRLSRIQLAAADAEYVRLRARQRAQRVLVAGLTPVLADARASAASGRSAVDDVARSLYQYGHDMPEVSAMLGGPTDYIDSVEAGMQADDAATRLVRASDDAARNEVAVVSRVLALTAGLASLDQRVAALRTTVASLTTAVATGTTGLAAATAASAQTVVPITGCPAVAPVGALRGGSETFGAERLCATAVRGAATPQAALAIQWAFTHLGATYACGGAGRLLPMRADCSSFVSRAYHEGAGLAVAGAGWAPSTRDMVPWGGARLDPHYVQVATSSLRPGDLVLYDTGGATYRHVVMYLGSVTKGGLHYMVHTNSCGDVAHVSLFTGFPATGSAVFLVARRVVPVGAEVARAAPRPVARTASAR